MISVKVNTNAGQLVVGLSAVVEVFGNNIFKILERDGFDSLLMELEIKRTTIGVRLDFILPCDVEESPDDILADFDLETYPPAKQEVVDLERLIANTYYKNIVTYSESESDNESDNEGETDPALVTDRKSLEHHYNLLGERIAFESEDESDSESSSSSSSSSSSDSDIGEFEA